MKYSKKDERIAQRRLRDIYNKKNRKQRIELAERFGYGGSDASKLRVLRRLTAQKIPANRTVRLNQYYKPFTTDEDRNPWLGKSPDIFAGETAALETEFGEKQLFSVVSVVMQVAEFAEGLESFSARLNAKGRIGETEAPAYSSDIPYLLEKYGKDAADEYKPVDQGGARLPKSGRLIGMAFSERGTRELRQEIKKITESEENPEGVDVGIPEAIGPEGYGIVLVPSTRRNLKGVGVYQYQRPLPKSKRDMIIEYTNRAKGPMGVS
jgi:hypothetical protein